MGQFDLAKFEVVRNAIDKSVADFIHREFELIKEVEFRRNNLEFTDNPHAFSDAWVGKSFSYYSPFCFETLALILKNKISAIVERHLVPTYSYGRIYYRESELTPHTDRDSCQYSATINIYNDSEPWDIWFKINDNESTAISLYPGDMIVYKGADLLHWRNPNPTNKVVQAFLHYVDSDGKFASEVYDGRKYLGFPAIPTNHANAFLKNV